MSRTQKRSIPSRKWSLVVPKPLSRHAKTMADVVALALCDVGEFVEYRIGRSSRLIDPFGKPFDTAWLERAVRS